MKERIQRLDKGDMRSAIKGCPRQITHILETFVDWPPSQPVKEPRQVLFLGMGGSAIGGDLVRVWTEQFSPVPMMVVRGYRVPNWVDGRTLVLASSYSGNTEETLAATNEAAEKGGRVAVITSGGQLFELAQAAGWDLLPIPGGLQPRAAIGYSVAAISRVLVAFGMLPPAVLEDLTSGAALMMAEGAMFSDVNHPENKALEVARLIQGRLPIIYGVTGTTETLALRLRGQLAENGKLFSSHNLLPEQNHNEIVGLAERIKGQGDVLVLWLEDEMDHPRVALRRDLAGRLMGSQAVTQAGRSSEITLAGKGRSLPERNLTLLHLIDWISYYVALLGDHDPSSIEILTEIKQEMSQMSQK